MEATTIHLVRHAPHGLQRHALVGRAAGVPLSEQGRADAERLAQRFAPGSAAAIVASPLERTMETAAALSRRIGASVASDEAFIEIDFGDWTGLTFDALRDDPQVRVWNERRATSAPPNGEAMSLVQARAMAGVERLRRNYPDAHVVVVSHADVIKSVLSAVLGLSLDAHARFDIATASISRVVVWAGGGKVLSVNESVLEGAS